MSQLFDSHIHLQRMDNLSTLPAQTTWALVPAVRAPEWQRMMSRYRNVTGIFLALGVHPQYAHEWNTQVAKQLRQLAGSPDVVAIGEAGLDGSIDESGQRQALVEQIELAAEVEKPLILHCHKRHDVLLELLRRYHPRLQGGIVHGYTGSGEMAAQLWQLGFAVGIGRTVLNPRARRLRTSVAALPEDSYVIETDAPWPQTVLAHHPDAYQGAGALEEIAAEVARLRGQNVTQVAEASAANARRILALDGEEHDRKTAR